jgi:hypothetical protein
MESIKMWVTKANLWCSHLIMGKCPEISTWKKLVKVNIDPLLPHRGSQEGNHVFVKLMLDIVYSVNISSLPS